MLFGQREYIPTLWDGQDMLRAASLQVRAGKAGTGQGELCAALQYPGAGRKVPMKARCGWMDGWMDTCVTPVLRVMLAEKVLLAHPSHHLESLPTSDLMLAFTKPK